MACAYLLAAESAAHPVQEGVGVGQDVQATAEARAEALMDAMPADEDTQRALAADKADGAGGGAESAAASPRVTATDFAAGAPADPPPASTDALAAPPAAGTLDSARSSASDLAAPPPGSGADSAYTSASDLATSPASAVAALPPSASAAPSRAVTPARAGSGASASAPVLPPAVLEQVLDLHTSKRMKAAGTRPPSVTDKAAAKGAKKQQKRGVSACPTARVAHTLTAAQASRASDAGSSTGHSCSRAPARRASGAFAPGLPQPLRAYVSLSCACVCANRVASPPLPLALRTRSSHRRASASARHRVRRTPAWCGCPSRATTTRS
jgi:hypothetical protein